MSKKQRRPCAVCSRGMAMHRGKRKVCSPSCDAELRLLLASARRGKAKGSPSRKRPKVPEGSEDG